MGALVYQKHVFVSSAKIAAIAIYVNHCPQDTATKENMSLSIVQLATTVLPIQTNQIFPYPKNTHAWLRPSITYIVSAVISCNVTICRPGGIGCSRAPLNNLE